MTTPSPAAITRTQSAILSCGTLYPLGRLA